MARRKLQRRPSPYVGLPVRVVLLASVGVIASVYALVRYYGHPRVPMYVPVEAGAPPAASGETEIELLPEGK